MSQLPLQVRWLILIILTSLTYGNLSALVSAKRLYFLASVTPHSALLAVILAVITSNTLGLLNDYLWATVIGCSLLIVVGYLIYREVNADIITSLYVASTASLSVLLMNYVLTNYKLTYSLWSIILGDPLLTTWMDVLAVAIVALLTEVITLTTIKYHIYSGVDLDFLKLSRGYGLAYELLFYLLLGISSVALIKVTGFILQHVLILLPAITAARVCSSSRCTYILSIAISTTAGVLGLVIAILANTSPSGSIGAILISIYLIMLLKNIVSRKY
jgi:ABC-type Mn2+/Zn2+ transport system permease subunit